ncbi:MAG TPA: AAA family ATPase [Armatimonadota bacterium]|nr:AAA family ATPase [Armatimonadota bacterium]
MHLKSVSCHPEGYPTREHYPFNLAVFQQPTRLTLDSPITIFVGENGSGKSTLLEAMARKCGVYIWRDAGRTPFQHNPYQSMLPEYLSIEWADGRVPGSFFSADVFKDFTEILDEWASMDPGQLKHFGGKSLVTQSHGQSVMSFLSARCMIKGLYLFDEPEAALSPKSQIHLRDVLTSMAEAGHAQFIMCTHSPILLSCPGATLYSFDSIPISPVKYEETEHYKIYKRFIGE